MFDFDKQAETQLGAGVEPDIYVDNDPAKEYAGEDQQLDKATAVILDLLKTRPGTLAPPPPFPIKKEGSAPIRKQAFGSRLSALGQAGDVARSRGPGAESSFPAAELRCGSALLQIVCDRTMISRYAPGRFHQMALSRRAFVKTVGINGALAAMVAGRGREALAASVPDARQAPAQGASGPPPILLDSNENPYGPSTASLDAIRAAFGEACRYPNNFVDLTATLAKFHGVQPENILLGAGSSEILRMAVLAFTTAGRPLVQGLPTFESPSRDAELAGAPVVNVPVGADLKLDLAGMAEKAAGAGLVFLCNPNNPTGTVHGADEIGGFVRRVLKSSPTTCILVDEAYHDYVEDPAYRTARPLALENPQVVLARTFSKVYGLAGVRVGYAVGRADTLKAMGRFRIPSNVNVLAGAAAIAALPQTSHVARQVALNREARDFTRRAFEEAGYKVVPPCANFLMVDIRRDAKAFQDACEKQGVLVGRPFPPLTNYARVSIGTLEEMRRAMAVIRRVLA